MITGHRVLQIGEAEIEFAFEELVVIQAERDPELGFALLGVGLLLLGLVTHMLWPPVRAYLSCSHSPNGTICRIYASSREARHQWYRCLNAMFSQTGSDKQ
mgnify:FL=1